MDRMNRNTATAVSALELEELVNASGGVLALPKKRTAIMMRISMTCWSNTAIIA